MKIIGDFYNISVIVVKVITIQLCSSAMPQVLPCAPHEKLSELSHELGLLLLQPATWRVLRLLPTFGEVVRSSSMVYEHAWASAAAGLSVCVCVLARVDRYMLGPTPN